MTALSSGPDTPDRPKRIQLRRTRGWRKPEGAIVVSRPSRWGNPFVVHDHTPSCYGEFEYLCPDHSKPTRDLAAKAFDHLYRWPCIGDPRVPNVDEIREHLAGHDLACWCPLVDSDGTRVPCHADVLLAIANGWPS